MKALVIAAIAIMLSASVLAVTTISESSPQGWQFLEENLGGSGGFASASAAPRGEGGARFKVDSKGGGLFASRMMPGARLSALTNMQYYTYRSQGSGRYAPSLQFNIDFNLSDSHDGDQGRLVYEPYFTEKISSGAWQFWDPFSHGKWWFTHSPGKEKCSQQDPCYWSDVLHFFPEVGIHQTNPLVGFKAGGGWSGGFEGYVDYFTLGFEGKVFQYDFESGGEPAMGAQATVSEVLGENMCIIDVHGDGTYEEVWC